MGEEDQRDDQQGIGAIRIIIEKSPPLRGRMAGSSGQMGVKLRYILDEMAQPRFVARSGVFVDNTLARGFVNDRYGRLQCGFGRGFVGG